MNIICTTLFIRMVCYKDAFDVSVYTGVKEYATFYMKDLDSLSRTLIMSKPRYIKASITVKLLYHGAIKSLKETVCFRGSHLMSIY